METPLVCSFYQMLAGFSTLFRADVLPTFYAISLAWLLAPCPGRTSSFLRTFGENRPKHYSSYYRFFSNAHWCVDLLGLGLLKILYPLIPDGILRVVFDDTLLKHRGPHIWGASVFRDPVLSSRKNVVKRWGLNWVVLVVILRNPLEPGTFIAIPILSRLFLTEQWCEKLNIEYQSPTELANEMLLLVESAKPPALSLRVAADCGYTNQFLALDEDSKFSYTGRVRSDANLQYPVSRRKYKGRGRRPVYGLPAPKPRKILRDRRRKRKKVTFTSYQGKQKTVSVLEFFGTQKKIFGTRTMRFVFFQEPGKEAVYLVTSDLESELRVILEDLVSRWPIEVCFREAKQLMGVEKSQVRCEASVLRMAAFGFWLQGLLKLWYLRHGYKLPTVRRKTDWYEPKGVSFSTMLSTFRYLLLMTLLKAPKEADEQTKAFSDLFGLSEEVEKKKSLLLRIFCGC